MKYIYILLTLMFMVSCSYELENSAQGVETVNGFKITWRQAVTSDQQDVVRQIVSNMVRVQGGNFVMGATLEQIDYARPNEYPLCYVDLSDYYICKYEVSEEQFLTIIPDAHKNNVSYLSLNWDDWQTFIATLNEISGLHFDLPSEAQWEYAARGGQKSKGYVYPGSNVLADVWTDSKENGSQTPNELGLYNMADLKSEWCKDCYYDYEAFSSWLQKDPFVFEGKYRIVRGGNYHCSGNVGSKYTESSSNNSFGYYKKAGSLLNPYDYRYCRITARSYYYIPAESVTSEGGNSQYIGCRLVVNI